MANPKASDVRNVEALERIAKALERIADQFENAGVPGTPFERFNRAVGSVKTLKGAVNLWLRASRLLGPSEEPIARERLAKVAAGVSNVPRDVEPVAWFMVEVEKARTGAGSKK